MPEAPPTIPVERLSEIGVTDRSLTVWWSSWYRGRLNVLILRRPVDDPELRDSLVAKISARAPLDEIVRLLDSERYDYETRSTYVGDWPGYPYIERIRDLIAVELGWATVDEWEKTVRDLAQGLRRAP